MSRAWYVQRHSGTAEEARSAGQFLNSGLEQASSQITGLVQRVPGGIEREGGAMSGLDKPGRKKWSGPEKWQVILAASSLGVAVVALVGQLAQFL
ncbi:hypothetical protein [Streptomyces avermitilis]|uniref:hypothetical protein n=1 Tax=Streptomyces avermitilis TaxID=33903 RepID=UPI003820392B